MQIMNMGNDAHGNQPIQHMIYLYNYAGKPWKTQSRVREVSDKLYSYPPDVYCGDEENGQISAWYVFSAIGFYPVIPGADEYVFSSLLFNKVTMNFKNGKKLIIEARENSKDNIYVQNIKLNGKRIDNNFIKHGDLNEGGKLIFKMGHSPEMKRGTND